MRGGMPMLMGLAAMACLGVGVATLVADDGTEPVRRRDSSPRRDPRAPHAGSREIERRLRQEARRAAKAAQ